jgi:hypothetical protein
MAVKPLHVMWRKCQYPILKDQSWRYTHYIPWEGNATNYSHKTESWWCNHRTCREGRHKHGRTGTTNILPGYQKPLHMMSKCCDKGRAIAQAISGRLPTAAAKVRARVNTYVICNMFSSSTSVSPANHSTDCSIIIIIHNPRLVY